MTKIQIKRVYEPDSIADGFRVLVDKLWPRGIKKENLHYDYWAKEITPSSGLREWFHEDQEKHWMGFQQKYKEELSGNPAVKDFIQEIKDKDTVTLLFASKNAVVNHALVLQDYLARHLTDFVRLYK